jgi:dimethylhistidine N-methyltransferase
MSASLHWLQRRGPITPAPQHDGFAADLLAALEHRPRSISPKYFYDAAGSALFDRICELPEYYPTRTELAILSDSAAAMAERLPQQVEIVEFGAGSLRKVRLLLDALRGRAVRYIPIDISGEHLAAAAAQVRLDYPWVQVEPWVADYTQPMHAMPALAAGAFRLGFFPGSTIGNLAPAQALHFLREAASVLRGGALLLGTDMVKDPAVLHAAYNDAAGVTAAFNLNLLVRANRELGSDFVSHQFAHHAFYNAPLQRIEMHLISRVRQTVHLSGKSFEFLEGETLHTENSHKFTPDSVSALAQKAGMQLSHTWTDAARWFSVHWLDVSGD